MHNETADCIIIGAGVIGLACARALAMRGREVLVLEAEHAIGMHTSSRNSEVIHAGIYYPGNSLKAHLCVQGKKMLYTYAKERGITHKNCGKIIVATNAEQMDALNNIKDKAAANGVDDLVVLSQQEALAREPALSCTGALLSPSTGIIDTHALMLALLGDLEHAGGLCVLNSHVISGRIQDDGISLTVRSGDEIDLKARSVINAAGLHALPLARKIGGFPQGLLPQSYYAKGNYFACAAKNPFSHLIYPVPEQAGLGVHLTFDLGGKIRFGPDVEWVEDIDYRVDPARAISFYPAIRSYWPDLPDGSLMPDYAGIRPKIQAPGGAAADFVIQGPKDHGIPDLVNLFGIESPGMTSCLALAEHVSNTL